MKKCLAEDGRRTRPSVLVTGALGFIASNYIRFLLKQNKVDVVITDRQTSSKKVQRLQGLAIADSILWQDLTHGAGDVLQDVDEVVHFAAETYVDNSIKDAKPFVDSNVVGTFNLLEGCRKWGVKRLLLFSTDEVYGSLPEGVFATESFPLNPTNPYAATKASADLLTLSYHNTYGLNTVVTRCGNIYGPWQHPEKAIPVWIKHALKGQPLPVYGDGSHKRMWVYVDDVCQVLEAVRVKGVAGEVYNIANDAYDNIAVAKIINVLAGLPAYNLVSVDDKHLRPGHDRRYAMDDDKVRTMTGWLPTVDLTVGLSRTYYWFKDHPQW